MPGAVLPMVLGCDFSSSPSPRKPVVVAWGHLDADAGTVALQGFDRFATLAQWQDFCSNSPPGSAALTCLLHCRASW